MVWRTGGKGFPCGSYLRIIRSVTFPDESFLRTCSSTCSMGTVRPLMDWVVTSVCDPSPDLVCEIAGPSVTRLPLMSSMVALLTFDCWALRPGEPANAASKPVRMQYFTVPG